LVTGSDYFIPQTKRRNQDETTTTSGAFAAFGSIQITEGGGLMSVDLAVGLLNLAVGLGCLYLAMMGRA
jgi:hypothetical protein